MVERRVAVKTTINEILTGKYVQEEGWNPNYLETANGTRIYRLNIIGAVVAVMQEEDSWYVDDGTGTVLVRNFSEKKQMPKAGDFVIIIGKVRETGSTRYISCEIVRKTDPSWIIIRRKELETNLAKAPITEEEKPAVRTNKQTELAISILKNSYNEASVEELLSKGVSEEVLQELLSDGTIFQNRPGYVQLVEN